MQSTNDGRRDANLFMRERSMPDFMDSPRETARSVCRQASKCQNPFLRQFAWNGSVPGKGHLTAGPSRCSDDESRLVEAGREVPILRLRPVQLARLADARCSG